MKNFVRRHRTLLIVLVVVVAAGVGLYATFFNQPQQSGSTEVVSVRRGDIRSTIRTTGRVEAKRSVRVGFRAGGIISAVRAQIGDYVPSGTVLAELDTTQARRDLASVENRLAIARFSLQSTANKAGILFSDDPLAVNTPAATPATRTTPALPAGTTPADFYAAVAQVRQAEADAQAARARLDDYRVIAPFDGTVVNVAVVEGEGAGQGSEAVTLADIGNLRIRADIDEVDIAAAAIGQSADISLDAFPGQQFTGTIINIAPAAAQRSGTTAFPAQLDFKAPPGLSLRPGMAANVIITATAHLNTLVVLSRAIETVGLKKYVNRVTGADGQTARVEVQTGLSNADQIEVVNGLADGDKVVLHR